MKKWMYAVFPCVILGVFLAFYFRRGHAGDAAGASMAQSADGKEDDGSRVGSATTDTPLTGPASPIPAGEPPIIAKARGRLGSDGALDAVTSIHFIGTLLKADPADSTKQIRSAIEIISQKPDRQRVQEVSDRMIDVTALDGYDAWQRRHNPANPEQYQQSLLGPSQTKSLRANTWENVAFYRGAQNHGGRVEDQGPETVEGISCQKVAFIYGPTIAFYRYFDLSNGRLVMTKTAGGATIREQGEIVARGIRFPKSLVQTSPLPNGQIQTVTIEFERVLLNESLPRELFAVPLLLSK